MNVAMEQTEEYVDGQLKVTHSPSSPHLHPSLPAPSADLCRPSVLQAKYGDSFIRGNNILYISAQKRRAKA